MHLEALEKTSVVSKELEASGGNIRVVARVKHQDVSQVKMALKCGSDVGIDCDELAAAIRTGKFSDAMAVQLGIPVSRLRLKNATLQDSTNSSNNAGTGRRRSLRDDNNTVEPEQDAWQSKRVGQWSVEDVQNWLIDAMQLPSVATACEMEGLSGEMLPLMERVDWESVGATRFQAIKLVLAVERLQRA
jgi:FtsZ-binding cell division protein ZapB